MFGIRSLSNETSVGLIINLYGSRPPSAGHNNSGLTWAEIGREYKCRSRVSGAERCFSRFDLCWPNPIRISHKTKVAEPFRITLWPRPLSDAKTWAQPNWMLRGLSLAGPNLLHENWFGSFMGSALLKRESGGLPFSLAAFPTPQDAFLENPEFLSNSLSLRKAFPGLNKASLHSYVLSPPNAYFH